jgi:hypothetical protein
VSKATFVPAVPAVIEVVVKQAAQPAKVVLELTEQEALALRRVFGRISARRAGPNGLLVSIKDSLNAAGITYARVEHMKLESDYNNIILHG